MASRTLKRRVSIVVFSVVCVLLLLIASAVVQLYTCVRQNRVLRDQEQVLWDLRSAVSDFTALTSGTGGGDGGDNGGGSGGTATPRRVYVSRT
jgi:hypothetical protein